MSDSKSHIEWLEEQCTPKKPRPMEQIIMDFVELEYECVCYSDSELILEKFDHIYVDEKEIITRIHINRTFKQYGKERITIGRYNNKTMFTTRITIQEHKLLNELFKCWGWI